MVRFFVAGNGLNTAVTLSPRNGRECRAAGTPRNIRSTWPVVRTKVHLGPLSRAVAAGYIQPIRWFLDQRGLCITQS